MEAKWGAGLADLPVLRQCLQNADPVLAYKARWLPG